MPGLGPGPTFVRCRLPSSAAVRFPEKDWSSGRGCSTGSSRGATSRSWRSSLPRATERPASWPSGLSRTRARARGWPARCGTPIRSSTRAIVAAFEEAEPFDDAVHRSLDEPGQDLISRVLPALATSLERRSESFVLILDDAHLLAGRSASLVLATIAEHLPWGSQLAFASRTPLDLPLGRLRAHRALLELGAHDLSMNVVEAMGLLGAAGVRAASGKVRTLVERTEGLPAGLYLAAVSALEEPGPGPAFEQFRGDHRVVAHYLQDEFLTGLSAEQIDFLVLTSVLEQLSGPLCDGLLDRTDSVYVLDGLLRAGFPLQSSDPLRGSYRLHRLLREIFLGELRHGQPEREAGLHLRASAFHAASGDFDRAIDHAVAAREPRLVGDLLWEQL